MRLTRFSTAFAAVSNVWFVILWSRAAAELPGRHEWPPPSILELPLWTLLAGGAVSAACLYAFGAALNDVLDADRDRAMRRQRPVAQGEVGSSAAVLTVAGTLIGSGLGATVFGIGGVIVTLLVSAAILGFNAAARFFPGFGLVLVAAIYGAHAMAPNPHLAFVWPIWFLMTHALVVSGAAQVLGRRLPPLTRPAMWTAGAGWLATSAVLIAVGYLRSTGPISLDPQPGVERVLWPEWVPWWAAIAPLALAVAFGLFVRRRLAGTDPGPRAAEKITRYGALWLPLYGVAWLAAIGAWLEAAVLAGLALGGTIGLTTVREVRTLIERPVEFRRTTGG